MKMTRSCRTYSLIREHAACRSLSRLRPLIFTKGTNVNIQEEIRLRIQAGNRSLFANKKTPEKQGSQRCE
jgi:hypothetical protein